MKIAFFGDSFTQGVGDPDGLGWAGRLGKAQGFTVANFGVQGDTGTDILARWRGQAEGAHPDRIVFCFGANDCLLTENKRIRVGQVDRLRIAKTLMVDAGKMAPVLFVSPFPVADDAAATNRIGEMARQLITFTRLHKTPYVNIFDAVMASDIWRQEALAGDGAHPGAGGYGLVVDLIAQSPVWQDWLKG
ncbi:GDSL-type esterase/lipase family protein [Kordiimonas marina]|uniref:GDSL-type esterase/lipase family protein n=1 Tax=Kordiimonas marina TaxID=2872312 RepID=UPI001FF36D31|nr:GDSL-type esterase/lipase family protein [Kordiimonas marina]MCJ9429826.1 hypothetical protein [Kordiimonas marina]